MARRGLGKGLNALIPSSKEEKKDTKNRVLEIPLDDVEANRNQPRKNFDENSLRELADSIKEFGVIQPIIVRENGNKYEIVAGERRVRASRIAGLRTIPGIIAEDIDDTVSVEMALIENIHRDNLSPMELAFTYKQLIDEFKVTHEELAKRVGKSRTAITNSIRLLSLPVELQKLVDTRKISAGHARALLTLEDKKGQMKLANQIMTKSLTVRDVENLVNKMLEKKSSKKRGKVLQFSKIPKISEKVSDYLNAPVNIRINKNKGKMTINFSSIKDLERIFKKIVE